MIVFKKLMCTVFDFGEALKLFVVLLKCFIVVGFILNADSKVILGN